MNKRTGFAASSVIAVQSSEAGKYRLFTPRLWPLSHTPPYQYPPTVFEDLFDSVFKDEVVLENGLLVYAELDRNGYACKGFRNTEEMIGLCDKVVRAAQSILLDNLDNWRLINICQDGKRLVRLVQREPGLYSEDEISLRVGQVLIWWTGVEGSYAQTRERDDSLHAATTQ
jgi:hypothetical protein